MTNLRPAAACFTLLAATAAQGAPADPVAPDVYPFVTAIAAVTAGARIGGSEQRFERVVTFGRDAAGQLVVTSLSVLRAVGGMAIPSGAVGVLIVHYDGQCGPPLGSDDYPAANGVLDFVADPTGKVLWEITTIDGARQIRRVDGPGGYGRWETFQTDPSRYQDYKCAAAAAR